MGQSFMEFAEGDPHKNIKLEQGEQQGRARTGLDTPCFGARGRGRRIVGSKHLHAVLKALPGAVPGRRQHR